MYGHDLPDSSRLNVTVGSRLRLVIVERVDAVIIQVLYNDKLVGVLIGSDFRRPW